MKIIKLPIAVIAITIMSSCYRVAPDAGVESVLIKKPWFFGHGGVMEEPISTGSVWCVASTNHEEFSITPMTITEEFVNLIPADNTPVTFSVYLKVKQQAGNTPLLCEKYGTDWYARNVQATFRTMVRDKACVYKMFDLASKRDISSKLEKEIFNDISAYVTKLNIPVDILQVLIGAVIPPEQVLTETKLTAAQNQSMLTQTARAAAELSRRQAEVNKAIADRTYQQQMGMNVEQYLHLRQLEIEKEKVELIKDNNNVTVIFGQNVPYSYPVE